MVALYKRLCTVLRVLDLRFEEDRELEYTRSLQELYFVPIYIAGFLIACQTGLSLAFAIIDERFYLLRVERFTAAAIAAGFSFCLVLVTVVKHSTGRLQWLPFEGVWSVCYCAWAAAIDVVLYESLTGIEGPDPESEPFHHQFSETYALLVMTLLTVFTCQVLPVRCHVASALASSALVGHLVVVFVAGVPWTTSVFSIVPFVAMTYCSLHGTYNHGSLRREKWLAHREVRRLELLARGVDTDAYAKEEALEERGHIKHVLEAIPNLPRVCILGGTAFQDPDDEVFVKCLAKAFGERFSNEVVVFTGGMHGVQQTFAEALNADFGTLVHLLPEGQSSNFKAGHDVTAGHDLPERMQIFGALGHIYLCIEGGPGVAKEAKMAHERGAIVLPMMFTGGASSGMFGFPSAALDKPARVEDKEWDLLKTKNGLVHTAVTVVDIIAKYVEEYKADPTIHLFDERSLSSLSKVDEVAI